MKKLLVLILILTGINCYVIHKLIQPVAASVKVDRRVDFIRSTLTYLGCPGQIAFSVEHGLKAAENRTGISGVLLACLIYTESGFRTDVVSRKGYRGLMQTPTATGIPLIDISHGADILKEKLHLTNGNFLRALTLYKGGKNKEAKNQAKYVLMVYNQLIKRIS